MANDKDDDRIVISIISDDETPKKNNVKKTTPAPKRTQEAPKNKNYRNNDRQDKRNAKKILKNRMGGFFLKSEFTKEIEKKGLTVTEAIKIKDTVKKEIDDGKLNSKSVDNRIDYLISKCEERKNEYCEKRIKYINEYFESEEIKRQIELWELNESSIEHKNDIIKKVKTEPTGKYSEEKLRTIIGKVIAEETVKKINSELESYKKEWPTHFKNLIKDSGQDIELTDHEIRYIEIRTEHFKKYSSIEQINTELKLIIPKVLSNRQLIGEYDSAGVLTEEGGLANSGPPQDRHLKKANNINSDVFIKIKDDKLILTESNSTDYFNENPIFRKRTFFFKDIVLLNKGIRTPIIGGFFIEKGHINRPGVELNLINSEKLKLYFEDEEKVNLLYDKWEAYKENQENEVSSSPQESNSNIGEDILKYAELYEKGLLTEEEFTALKKKLLNL